MEKYKTHTIAIFSDDTSSLSTFVNTLENGGFETLAGTLGDRFIFYSSDDIPDLIILDINSYNSNFYSICKEISKIQNLKDLPILLICASNLELNVSDLYNAGIDDFINKPFHNLELFEKIRIHLELSSIKRELQNKSIELNKTLNELKNVKKTLSLQSKMMIELKKNSNHNSTHDISTNLYSRKFMLDNISSEISRFDRKKIPFTLILLELDSFEELKSKYDNIDMELLFSKIGNALNSLKRQEDLIGRWSNNQFLFLLKDTNQQEANTSYTRLTNSLKNTPFELDNKSLDIKFKSSYIVYNKILPLSIFYKMLEDSLINKITSNQTLNL